MSNGFQPTSGITDTTDIYSNSQIPSLKEGAALIALIPSLNLGLSKAQYAIEQQEKIIQGLESRTNALEKEKRSFYWFLKVFMSIVVFLLIAVPVVLIVTQIYFPYEILKIERGLLTSTLGITILGAILLGSIGSGILLAAKVYTTLS